MAILDIYVDPDITTNPAGGAGTTGNPYNHLGQCSQAGSANELRIHHARGRSEEIDNFRITSGSQTGKIVFDTWETYDGRTQRPQISMGRLVNFTWSRGKLTAISGVNAEWTPDVAGNVWAGTAVEMTETNMFMGFSQPEAGYPNGRPRPRRKTSDTSDNAPGEAVQLPTANGQWGVSSNTGTYPTRVWVYSDGGISPGTRYGQFYVRYKPYVDSATLGNRAITFIPLGGAEVRGLHFINCDVPIQWTSASGLMSAPIAGVKVLDNWFECCQRTVIWGGRGAGTPTVDSDFLTYTNGFVNARMLRNRMRNLGGNGLQFLSAPAMNGFLYADNALYSVNKTYSDAGIYVDGFCHTTDGGYAMIVRNYVEDCDVGNVWPVDGAGIYLENGAADTCFMYNLIVDCQLGLALNGTRRKAWAKRNWFLNRSQLSGVDTARCGTRYQGGGSGDYAAWTAQSQRTRVEENAYLNHPVIIGSDPTGWGTGIDHLCIVKGNVAMIDSGSSSGRKFVQAKDNNAPDYYDVNGNVTFGFGSQLWTSRTTDLSSNLKGHVTADKSAVLRDVLDLAYLSMEELWQDKANPALLLPPGPPKQYLTDRKALATAFS